MLGFCGGRSDAVDGGESRLLGPTQEQEAAAPCKVPGRCKEPLGSRCITPHPSSPLQHRRSDIREPRGPPRPASASPERARYKGHLRPHGDGGQGDGGSDRRRSRLRQDPWTLPNRTRCWKYQGKLYSWCKTGPKPKDSPLNPWPGTCGSGKGEDTFTSGFEFPFTTRVNIDIMIFRLC